MKISQIKYYSTVNGRGIRTAIFVSGCNLHCKGCFNSEAWDFNFGHDLDGDLVEKILDSIDFPWNSGLSILGGEPLDPRNQEAVKELIECFRQRFGNSKNLWLWTGYEADTVPETNALTTILKEVDVLVDGPYNSDLRKSNLPYRGSTNQTIWEKVNGEFVKSKLNEECFGLA